MYNIPVESKDKLLKTAVWITTGDAIKHGQKAEPVSQEQGDKDRAAQDAIRRKPTMGTIHACLSGGHGRRAASMFAPSSGYHSRTSGRVSGMDVPAISCMVDTGEGTTK